MGTALPQTPRPTIRVQVKGEAGPVQGATVTADGRSATTGPDGVAVLPAALGHAEVSVTKEGFFPASAALDVDAAREWPVDVELQPRKERQEQITVYATRTDTRLQDSPLHIEVVLQDEINEELAMRPGDITMLLNEMGGMRVQTTFPALGAASVRMQGMLGPLHRVFVRRPAAVRTAGGGPWAATIPPMDLGQVEVIKGDASALYGSAALAGVVDLISRRPEDKPLHEFLFNESSLGETDASMFLASQLAPHWARRYWAAVISRGVRI